MLFWLVPQLKPSGISQKGFSQNKVQCLCRTSIVGVAHFNPNGHTNYAYARRVHPRHTNLCPAVPARDSPPPPPAVADPRPPAASASCACRASRRLLFAARAVSLKRTARFGLWFALRWQGTGPCGSPLRAARSDRERCAARMSPLALPTYITVVVSGLQKKEEKGAFVKHRR